MELGTGETSFPNDVWQNVKNWGQNFFKVSFEFPSLCGMFDLSKIFDLSKKFALPDTLIKSKNYCSMNTPAHIWDVAKDHGFETPLLQEIQY